MGTSQYYYGKFRFHARHPWSPRSLEPAVPEMKKIEAEDRRSNRAQSARRTGYTGLSILHRLHSLYGFDVLHDTVYDAMHNIPLNVASHHLQYYFDNEILNRSEVEARLQAMPWTPGIK